MKMPRRMWPARVPRTTMRAWYTRNATTRMSTTPRGVKFGNNGKNRGNWAMECSRWGKSCPASYLNVGRPMRVWPVRARYSGDATAASSEKMEPGGDGVAIATHGCSFYVLDDITPLRLLKPTMTREDVRLCAAQGQSARPAGVRYRDPGAG